MMEGRLKRMAVFPAKLDQNRTNSVSGAVKVRTMTVMMFLLLLVECLNTSTNAKAPRLWCFLLADAKAQQTWDGPALCLEKVGNVLNPRSSKQEEKSKWLVLRLGHATANLDGSLTRFSDDSSTSFLVDCNSLDASCLERLEEGMRFVPHDRMALQMGDDAMRQFLISPDRDLIQYPIAVHFIECMTPPLVFDGRDSSCRGGSAFFDPPSREKFTEFLPIIDIQSVNVETRQSCFGGIFRIPENLDVFDENESQVLSGPGTVLAEMEGLKIVTSGDKQNATGAISNVWGERVGDQETEHGAERFYPRLVLRQRRDDPQITALECNGKPYTYDFQRGGLLSLISKSVELTLPYKREVVLNRHEIRFLPSSSDNQSFAEHGTGGSRIFCYRDDLPQNRIKSADDCASVVERERDNPNGIKKSYIVASDNEEEIGLFLNRMYARTEKGIVDEVMRRFSVLLVKEDRDEDSPANRSGSGRVRHRTSSLSVWESFYPIVAVAWKIEYIAFQEESRKRVLFDAKPCYGSLDLQFETRKWALRFENGELNNFLEAGENLSRSRENLFRSRENLSRSRENLSVRIHFALTKMYLTTNPPIGERNTSTEIPVLANLQLKEKVFREDGKEKTLTLTCDGEKYDLFDATEVNLKHMQLLAKANHRSIGNKGAENLLARIMASSNT